MFCLCLQGGRWESPPLVCSSLGFDDSLHPHPGPLVLPANLLNDTGPLPHGPVARWDGLCARSVLKHNFVSRGWFTPFFFLQCVEVQLTGNVLFLCSFSPPVDTCQLTNKQSGFTRTMSRTRILTKKSEMQCQFLQSSYCWVIRYRHSMEAQWHVEILISWSLTIKCLFIWFFVLRSLRKSFFL